MDSIELYSNIRQTMELTQKLRIAGRCRFNQICELDSSSDKSLQAVKKVLDLDNSQQEEIFWSIDRVLKYEPLTEGQLKALKEQVDKMFVANIHMCLGIEACYRGIAGLNGQA